jgi:molybdate/tungstate transport system ATP-binding protein
MIAPAAVKLPAARPEVQCHDSPVTARVETLLNLGANWQVALRCGSERLWLAAQSSLVRHHGLEPGREITVDLRGSDLLCWPRSSRAGG